MLNYLIHVDGKSPLKYDSRKFWKFLEGHDGKMGAVQNPQKLLKKLGLEHVDCPKFKSMRMFKSWLIRNVKEGHCVDFASCKKIGGLHSLLIIDYNKAYDSFKCVNAQFLTNESPIEYLTFEQLTHMCYFNKKYRKSKYFPYYTKPLCTESA